MVKKKGLMQKTQVEFSPTDEQHASLPCQCQYQCHYHVMSNVFMVDLTLKMSGLCSDSPCLCRSKGSCYVLTSNHWGGSVQPELLLHQTDIYGNYLPASSLELGSWRENVV